jgi:hypothetical protein
MPLPPLAIFNVVVRNAVPIIGVLFFHWSAANLLILYFIDTLLAVGVIAAGFCYHLFPVEEAEGVAARINTIFGYAAGGAIVAAIIAIPLGMPIFILVFGVGDVSARELVRDQGFLLGLALQAIASLVSFRDLVVALHKHTPDQLGLKRRFAFVFLRWVGMLFVAFTPIPYALGRYGAFVLVIVYVALTIYAELKPDRFLAAFGEADKQ